jgi:hypothetical protein
MHPTILQSASTIPVLNDLLNYVSTLPKINSLSFNKETKKDVWINFQELLKFTKFVFTDVCIRFEDNYYTEVPYYIALTIDV